MNGSFCESTWLPKRWLIKTICLWWCFWKRAAFDSADWVKRSALSNVGGHHPIHRGPKWNKKSKGRKNSLSLLELECLPFPALCNWSFWFSGIWTRTELYHGLSWFSSLQMPDYGTSCSPYVPQPVPIIKISHWVCVSGEPWLIYRNHLYWQWFQVYVQPFLFHSPIKNEIREHHLQMRFTHFKQ